jgi:S-adenosylmethionine hydrolase
MRAVRRGWWLPAWAAGILALGILAGCGSTPQQSPLVVLFSDVGTEDYSLAQLQGDLYAGFPAARVVHGATDMPAFDVAAGAYIIDLASGPYPEGTIFVGAVTPGDLPGTSCLAAVSKQGHIFVAPDNGLLTRVARDPGLQAVYRIQNQALFPRPLADSPADWVLARAAALIASGRPPQDLGPAVSAITTLDLPDARLQSDRLRGTIVFVDRFGNCLTNIPAGLAAELRLQADDSVAVSWPGGRATMRVAGAYGDVPLGTPLALLDGASPLQLAVNRGSFAEKYGIGAGAAVTLTRAGARSRTEPAAARGGRAPAVLTATQAAVQTALERLDQDLARAAVELATTGLEGAEARAVLRRLVARHPDVVDFTTVGATGTMLLVEPAAYRSSEGTDISAQEQVIRLHATLRPVLSRTFKAAEGFFAVDLEHPVLRADGTLAGSISALFRTEAFLGDLIEPLAGGDAIIDKVWCMDTDGLIIYDPDAAQVGTSLFLDPLYQPYPDLLALGRQIARRPSGSGSYEFLAKGSTEVIVKDATWVSAGLHGTPWRLVAAFAGQRQ